MEHIKTTALNIYEEYGTADPFRICEEMGVYIMYADLPEVTRGLYYFIDDKKIILINQALSEGEARMTAAHELGHALLHPDINYVFMSDCTLMKTGRYEIEADYFCACLLLAGCADSCTDLNAAKLASLGGISQNLAQIWIDNERKQTQYNKT